MDKQEKNLNAMEPDKTEVIDAVAPNYAIRFLWVLPFLVALLFNLSVLDNGYVWNDYNLFERQLPMIKSVKDAFFPALKAHDLFKEHYFRPFMLLSYKVDEAVWGGDVKGYHLTVLLSHCLNTVLVYFLVLLAVPKMGSKYSIALFSASLFAVHPVHAEVVAWICGRNETFATNCALISLIFYALFRKKDDWLFLFCSCFFFLIGLFFKELTASVLFLVPLYDLCFYKKSYSPLTRKKENVSLYILFAGTFLLYYIVRKMSLGSLGLTVFKDDISIVRALVCSLGYYLKVTVLPLNLDYFIAKVPSSNVFFLGSFTALAAFLFIAAWSFFRGKRVIAFCVLSFLVILSPSLAVAITYLSETPLALRYLYFPSIGFVIALGYVLRVDRPDFSSRIPLSHIAKIVVFLLIFIFYQQVNARQLPIWKDDISLWSHVTKRIPEAGLPHSELGRAYTLAGRYNEAIAEYRKALETKYDAEGKSIVCNALGYIYLKLNDLDESEIWYRNAIRIRPGNYALPYYNLGFLGLLREERLVDRYKDPDSPQRQEILRRSIPLFKKAIEINPHYYKARYYLGMCYVKMGEKALAGAQLRALIELDRSSQWAASAQAALDQFQLYP